MTKKEILEEMFDKGVECNYCELNSTCEDGCYPTCCEMECDYNIFDIDRYLRNYVERKF